MPYCDAIADHIARAILKSQEIFNQTFGMPEAIYIECHDEEIMRGREEAAPRRPLWRCWLFGRGGGLARRTFLKAASYP